MEKKKLKLTIYGSSKKTINNIELAKSHRKNSVVNEKKNIRIGSTQNINVFKTLIENPSYITFLGILNYAIST